LTQLNATYLDGLVGDVAIPKQTGAATAGWIGSDGGTIGESDQTVGMVTLTPRTVGVFTDYSRQLRLQSSPSVENFIRQDLAQVVALEKDRAAFHGTGSGGQPVGIANTTGIGTQAFATGSTPTRSEVVGMRGDIASANALTGSLAFATESTVYSNMLDTVVDAGSGQFLLSENGTLLGRQVVESNQITDGQMFFGNFSDLMVGEWGGYDLMVDPFTGATAGNVRILIFHSCDIAVRHAESFTLGQ
jgi:HK97 family phage major capsid protein